MPNHESMEFTGIDWQQFGLRKNPYDTRPLLEGGDAPIDQLFIGRKQERSAIDQIFASDERACLTVCGRVGVGKTSLANFIKHVWKNERPKLLFSSRREIEASINNLTKQQFILGIVASVLREIELVDPELLKKDSGFQRLKNLTDVVLTIQNSWGLNAGMAGFSGGLSGGKNVSVNQPLQLNDTALEAHFDDLLRLIQKHEIGGKNFSGLIVHMNNFDVVVNEENGAQKAVRFFNEIRDFLQCPNVYFIFLGPPEFFREVISKEQRVKAVFSQSPVLLEPLSKTDLIKALHARMKAFKSDDVKQLVQPVEDEVVSRFYDLYRGDVRSVLSALNDTLKRGGNEIKSTLGVNEALALLARDRYEQIENILTPELKKMLWKLMESKKPMTQTALAQELGKQASNVSKYLKRLKERGVIEVVEEQGNNKFLDLSTDYSCLRFFLSSRQQLQEKAEKAASQLALGI